MATNLKTKKFTSQFERWAGTPPAGCRFMFNDAVTGKPYWITREDMLNGFNGTSDSGISPYQIYAGTTSDNPVLSEKDWIYSLYGHDGITPTIGSNGHWFIGTIDTGVKAQPENPIPAAQIFNAPMGALIFFVGLLSSLSDSWHLANGDYVEGFGYTKDWRGKVGVGFDDRKPAIPTSNPGMIENYGAIGNTGGKNFYKLTGAQSGIQEHEITIPGKGATGRGNSFVLTTGEGTKTTTVKADKVLAKDAIENHDNRMEYAVGAWIQRVKPEVLSGGAAKTSDLQNDSLFISRKEVTTHAVGEIPVFSAFGGLILEGSGKTLNDYVQKVPGKSLILDTEIARLAGVSNVDISGKENIGVAAQLISDLKAGVPAAGDTLLKLFNDLGLKINRSETLTATEIQLLISNLVDSSPETLNTLKELAAALGDDPNFATTVSTLIGTKLNASKEAIEALLTGLISSHYHTATSTTFSPTTTITATDVQSAIEEVEANVNGKISPKPASGTSPYTIGQHVAGGVVFYILQPSDHGYEAGKQKCLIVSLEDRSAGVQWSPGYAVTTATQTAIGYGLSNTLTILDNHVSSEWYAAKLCNYTPDAGYNDWYLGTLEEMMKLGENKELTGLSNLNSPYWTSSETSETSAITVQLYPINAYSSQQKNQSSAVRAIRTSVIDLGYSLPVDGEVILASGNDGKEVKGSGKTFNDLIGRGVVSVVRISGNGGPGATDTYRVTYTDNTFTEYQITNGTNGDPGRGIASVIRTTGNGSPGSMDTYTIALTDGNEIHFDVWNGANGTNGSSIELAPYNLSGLDVDIEIGQKVSHTMLEEHSFTAADIYLESTAAPTDFAIEVDVKKNGVSIFTTKPKINAGSLHLTTEPVLVTTPTVYSVRDVRTVSVESIGTTETGKNLVLSILMHK
jgi:hypothetical protein